MRSIVTGAAVLATALLVAGCSSLVADPGAGDAAESVGGQDTATTSMTSSTTSARSETRTPSHSPTSSSVPSSSTSLPGGTGDATFLTEAGWLSAGRLVVLRGAGAEAASTSGMSTRLSAELCSMIFGTAAEVAQLAKLPAATVLDEGSGWYHRNGGAESAADTEPSDTERGDTGLISCLYSADGKQLLALIISDGEPSEQNLPSDALVAADGDVHGVLSYSPYYQGAEIDPAIGSQWLHHAVARVTTAADGDP